MNGRREFPAKIKAAAFVRAQGHCEGCTARLFIGKFHYDHVIPDAMGGDPSLENCEVLCAACHSEKTRATDVPAIAKAKRQAAKHWGTKQSKRPMDGSRNSRWRKRMNGKAELR